MKVDPFGANQIIVAVDYLYTAADRNSVTSSRWLKLMDRELMIFA